MNKRTLENLESIISSQVFTKYIIAAPLPIAKSDLQTARPRALQPSDGIPPYVQYMQCGPEECGPLGEMGPFVGLCLRIYKLNIDLAKIHNGKYTRSCYFRIGEYDSFGSLQLSIKDFSISSLNKLELPYPHVCLLTCYLRAFKNGLDLHFNVRCQAM